MVTCSVCDMCKGGGEQVRDLKTELEQARTEVESLQAQLHKAKQHTEQYKTIADSIQQTIQEQNEVRCLGLCLSLSL